jgi:peroxiredoxin
MFNPLRKAPAATKGVLGVGGYMADQGWTILADGRVHHVPANGEGNRILVPCAQLPALVGWEVHEASLCRADRCVSLASAPDVTAGDAIDLRAVAELLRLPMAQAPAQRIVSLAESPELHSEMLRGGEAPDFAIADLAGQTHRLSDYRGRKVLLVTWASWCGCREDLAAWQAQYDALKQTGLVVMTVSQDARVEDARPFIEAAAPQHPALLDPDHVVSHRYGLINVPSAVWIDEAGRVARPPRVEHATNMFSFAHGLDCEPHLAALRRWAESGETDYSAEETRRTTLTPSFEEQLARAHHSLAWYLHQHGAQPEAEAHWAEAIRLSPHDWTIRRGSMWLRGANPFGSDFAEVWMEWEAAGRPDYASLAAARTGGAA